MTAANRVVRWADAHLVVWVGALTVVVVALLVTTVVVALRAADTAARTAQEQAIRRATEKAAVARCLEGIPGTERINVFVRGVHDLADVLVLNSQASLDAAPPGDPLQQTRRENLKRLRTAQKEVHAVEEFPVPTVANCAARG